MVGQLTGMVGQLAVVLWQLEGILERLLGILGRLAGMLERLLGIVSVWPVQPTTQYSWQPHKLAPKVNQHGTHWVDHMAIQFGSNIL